jgi:hypothetical protein
MVTVPNCSYLYLYLYLHLGVLSLREPRLTAPCSPREHQKARLDPAPSFTFSSALTASIRVRRSETMRIQPQVVGLGPHISLRNKTPES